MIKLIIFDLDGTLVNAYPAVSQSVNYTLSKLGFKPRSHAEIKRSVGWGDRHLMSLFVGEELADKAIEYYRPHHRRALKTPGGVKFLPGAFAILAYLNKAGYYLAIASNRPTQFTEIILKVLKVDHYFDVVLCADKAPKPKPAPDMLNIITKQLNVSKAQTLYVGDMTIDVNTGRRAKIKTVAVVTGSSSKKELKDLKPYKTISKISALKALINEGK